MKSLYSNILVLVAVVTSLSVSAFGQMAEVAPDQSSEVVTESGGMVYSVRVQAGHLSGEANEWVYNDDGSVLSQLIWEINSLVMVGIGATVELNKWFSLHGDYWTLVSPGEGTMDDYDWMVSGSDWSDWSHSDDVDVSEGSILDFSIELSPFRSFDDRPYSIRGILGHRVETFEWEERGGTYLYSESGFRDSSGSFTAGELGISYEQTFQMTYFGVAASYQWENFDFGCRVIGSPFVFGSADDQHHLRDFETHAELENGSMFSVALSGAYDLSRFFDGRQVVFSGAVNYTQYDTITADTTYSWADGSDTTYEDSEGADLETIMASTALTLTF